MLPKDLSHDLYPCSFFSKQNVASEVFQEFGNDDVGPVANLPGLKNQRAMEFWSSSSNPHASHHFEVALDGQFSQLFKNEGMNEKCVIYLPDS